MIVRNLNGTYTNDNNGNLVLYPFQATEYCVVFFNYRAFTGAGYTEISVSKTDENSNWLATLHTTYSVSRTLISNSGLAILAKGEKLQLVFKGGVANESVGVFGPAVAFKYEL